ncbi:hypothetical protein AUJ42_02360 [Candidatus Collierbacteria bacterium CG1_02_44_10]|uniref:Uncharacterized protein n=3 Tax=Candidatus Collieribacteriota TaxID=1752725 RepID=A0A2H0DV61_9BACT|nr:hypothetical protein [bacterium]OIN90993.1 MAG: hypothetical protein AUJ42_02360 [Candidatus Collierbacteria bacterium CG1_02_44_10]PIP86055.1 MAG: hypothetical protein COW83_00995 [Candidatus Collierbacteria bacterium CG22_combo_CG10-13_8_21_14_all_43_12]PIZ24589.1 MAG: hypothetical protein COY48_02155 [Candidatus Collierbacteria bacterium CG_4_10_14_0_8_um_filter_43_86]PJB47097.1 MAG: hypothetical protein CO104_04515 [Candidatus Collierbacteria bacterium CG_4_9_14_3_um_filter_43_16]
MKLQITITDEEQKLLAQRAAVLGYDVTKFAKFLLSHEAMKVVETPIIPFNLQTEDLISRAIADDEAGKTKKWVFGKYGN